MISHKEEEGNPETREDRSISLESTVQITHEVWIDLQILYKFPLFVNTATRGKSLTNVLQTYI